MSRSTRTLTPRTVSGRLLRAGDLVRLKGSHRKWAVLPVTAQDLRRGLNVNTPGLHLFGGYWYAQEAQGGPLRHEAYGKVLEVTPEMHLQVVGRVGSHYAARTHCR